MDLPPFVIPARFMNDRHQNEILNALLIDLGRSLLQYTAEAWPWTNNGEQSLRDEVDALADRQSQAAAEIADRLAKRTWPIDFGIYPVDYTDLNYVSLDYLLGEIAQNADKLVTDIHESRRQVDEPEASDLLSRIETEQRAIAARLRELADNVKQPAV
jgi:hypothetical protein